VKGSDFGGGEIIGGVAASGCGVMVPGARRTKTIMEGKGCAAVWLLRVVGVGRS